MDGFEKIESVKVPPMDSLRLRWTVYGKGGGQSVVRGGQSVVRGGQSVVRGGQSVVRGLPRTGQLNLLAIRDLYP